MAFCLAQSALAFAADPEESPEEQVSHEWLTWTAPPECPSRSELLVLFEAALGQPWDPDPEFSSEISVTGVEGGFFVRMRTSDASGSGVREVTVPSCVEAADFVALSIALALDQGPSEEVGPALADTQASELESSGAEAIEPTRAETKPLPPPEAAPVPAPTTNPPTPAASRPASPWFIGTSVDLASGLLPELGFGPSIRAGRVLGDWEVQVSTALFPGGIYELEEAFNPVALGWLGGSAGGCRLFHGPRWTAGVCAHVELGGVTGREQLDEAERTPHAGTGFFLGIVPKLEGRVHFGKHFQGLASVGASIPLAHDPFILSDGTPVFQSSPGIRASAGLLYFF